MFQIPECLDKKFKKAVERLNGCSFIRVIAHYDADGVSSASLIFNTINKLGKDLHISFLKDLSIENLKSVLNGNFDCLILVDLGSSFVSTLESYNNVIILDHHPPEKDSEKIVHINPHFCNISGTTDACGSTLSYIFSVYVNEDNWKEYPAFLSGVIGDKQNVNGYSGLNKLIVDFLEDKGIKKLTDITLDGPTVKNMLLLATDPFLPEYTGNEDAVSNVLNKLGIDPENSPSDMNEDLKTSLYSWIALNLLKRDVEHDIIQSIIAEKHFIDSYGIWDITLSSYVDAASRMNMQGSALEFLNGNMNKKEEIIETWSNFKKLLIKELYSSMNSKIEMENIQYFYVQENSIAGAAAGILMNYALNREKPVFAMHNSNGDVHVSGRATKTLIKKGLNLGSALRTCAEKNNGSGGGHDIAAGATIPGTKVDEFLNCLDITIGKQIEGS
ncbi:MAG: DHHA1 domain-containing protein [Thermoplasmata archaeon]